LRIAAPTGDRGELIRRFADMLAPTAWRSLFIAGVVATGIGAATAFGLGVGLSLAAAVAAVYAVLEFFISEPTKNDVPRVRHAIRNAIANPRIAEPAAVAVWLMAFGLFGWSTSAWYRTRGVMDVHGIVISASGSPVEKALVSISAGQKVLQTQSTDANGSFRFAGLNRRRRSYWNLSAAAGQLRSDLRLYPDSAKNQIVVRLPVGSGPIRVSYYDLDGLAIDLLLDGTVDSLMARSLGAQPYILPTATFRYLLQLRNEYPYDFHAIGLEVRSRRYNETIPPTEFSGFSRGVALFGAATQSVFVPLTVQEFRSELGMHARWNVEHFSVPTRGIGASMIKLWRYAVPSDLGAWEEEPQIPDYIRALTQGDIPPDLLRLTIECVCNEHPLDGCLPRAIGKALKLPPMRVRVAVIENTSANVIDLGDFMLRHNRRLGLRAVAADSATLVNEKPTRTRLFASLKLRPGESVLLALQAALDGTKTREEVADEYIRDSRHDSLGQALPSRIPFSIFTFSEVRGPDGAFYYTDAQEELISVNEAMVAALWRRPRRAEQSGRPYVFGPSSELTEVLIDGVPVRIRPREPELISVRGRVWSSGACCPHVYLPDTLGRWQHSGTVLRGREGRAQERTERHFMSSFSGTLRLAEEEPEIAWINQVEVTAVFPSGEERILRPKQVSVREQDSVYLRLARGDVTEIQFGSGWEGAESFMLSIRGYYDRTDTSGVRWRGVRPRLRTR
jgi:hypothetical protein